MTPFFVSKSLLVLALLNSLCGGDKPNLGQLLSEVRQELALGASATSKNK